MTSAQRTDSWGVFLNSSRLALLLTGGLLLLSACAPFSTGAAPAPSKTGSPKPSAQKSSLPYKAQGSSRILPGDVLIADAQNNRILLVTPQKKIVWEYPKAGTASAIRDDDDVFFGPHFDEIITNEENSNTLAIINFNTRKVVWTYGHQSVPGSAPGYLDTPDDAFLYDRGPGLITVADIKNQRILFIDRKTKAILKQYGETRVQRVDPPKTYGAPNGDFPAPNQGMLVTQINGNDAIRLNKDGQILWTLHFPQAFYYPSDANFTPSGNVIVAFYTSPGAVLIMNPHTGRTVWTYDPSTGPGRLNHPSLAVQLPNGNVLLNDDGDDRVIIINPKTKQIIWQYGHTGQPGSSPGYLNDPDGVDFLPAGIVPGAKNPIGHHLWSYPGNGY